ncbi:Rne/Rng family ribonuclease [Aneurinibacillus thermoaerophilus]|uniref:Rne/Rng family ribonuclease n=1 Tax=Aneurinibacillus thermoaerophilus TaxID=143495 RepID=UPI002E1F7B20|nr:Rne/Rng family ribonuclease [Aneurinibacillus thermoaerophilus]MED0678927.1 Rne/Rng family ribonuclease [Aneurinibacillus thermoaerophilus]MED0736464.1 Rne/Rng family ribonuclease [Aneurinibacillus thermoaerophilus]MED0763127.1 Rne/Rng family ribonuclease [Aneurinibacillus thermoaerophilus]
MKQIIINCTGREARVAMLEGGRLVELYIERPEGRRIVGNIYKGRVENVLPGMQAAFIDIGMEKNAYLYVADCLPPETEPEEGKRPSINELITQGQEIIVQVSKEAFGTKGAKVTTQLSLPGRYIVYLPNVTYIGVSRRIRKEKERERLRRMAREILGPNEGIIIRTMAEGMSRAELEADVSFLRACWEQVWSEKKHVRPPALVYQDLDLVSRVVRDFVDEEVEEIMIDSRPRYAEVRALLARYRPEWEQKIRLYTGAEEIFSYYGLDGEIERALRRKVWLKSGGYLVIDQTEAMTVFDVNTGKYTGSHTLEETVLKTNLEACREIVRQLRLRNIGGIIIIDFIDMEEEENRLQVLECMEGELRKDKTKTQVLGFTRLGLLELTRKKERQNLADILLRVCPCCEGTGRIAAEETLASALERELASFSHDDRVEAVLLEVHPHIARVFVERDYIEELRNSTSIALYIAENSALDQQRYRILFAGSEAEARRRLQKQ